MTYIITEPCVGVCDSACVEVCPVDCIYPAEGLTLSDEDKQKMIAINEMLYIHPEECIDCGACEPECPVEAIFPEDEVPDKWKMSHFKITEHLVKILRENSAKNNVAEEVVSKLEGLKDKEYDSKEEFEAALKAELGEDHYHQHHHLIVNPAWQNFTAKNYQRFGMQPGNM